MVDSNLVRIEKLIIFAKKSKECFDEVKQNASPTDTPTDVLKEFYNRSCFLEGFETYHLMRELPQVDEKDYPKLYESNNLVKDIRHIIANSRKEAREAYKLSVKGTNVNNTSTKLNNALIEIRNKLIKH